ncbi:hypothetical protein P167DRAFT_534131 [Morchella conica CCBAS932]|uniref:OPA3-domain-containing protein n=1 Tax=Morchella conica CCBAS932 TaxID=1392247 RepID=A0A3N4KXZ5_9PEZI|nr:hypothetical protein P167DRAFT_534131 [Morchella conica CCBAS932]
MSTTAIKLGSLAIKTLAKPMASKIKQQARDHPRFRKICVSIAQSIHQVDVRLRLGLLQDTAAFIKAEQADREAARQAAKKLSEGAANFPSDLSTVSSAKAVPPPAAFGSPKPGAQKPHSQKPHAHFTPTPVARPRVRPLSEAKAIESGANFISELFLFIVAGSLILAEQIRSRRKEAGRRDVIAERLDLLEVRMRQDEERLAQLEEHGSLDEKRIIALEEEIWKLGGGKGVYPGHRGERKERKIIEPTPLWESVSDTGTSLWGKLWPFGVSGEEDTANAEVDKNIEAGVSTKTRSMSNSSQLAEIPVRTPPALSEKTS